MMVGDGRLWYLTHFLRNRMKINKDLDTKNKIMLSPALNMCNDFIN